MAATETTKLTVAPREPGGSRSTRRLRREGRVPGIVYGGDGEPETFEVDARELRQALAHGGAVIELTVGDGGSTPVVVKHEQRNAVRGELIHLDLLRVRLDKPIHATTILDLIGADEAPGVNEGGVIDQITREINIEALPTSIPEFIQHDISAMEMNDTLLLSSIVAPEGVTVLDDLEETVVATLSPPRLEVEEPEIEEETELVGEDGEPIEAPEGEAEGDGDGDGGDADGGESGGEGGGEGE